MSGDDHIANGRTCGEDAAAYALGALEPSEAEAFRRHLRDCPDCQKEVAEFEQITGALPDASVRYEVPKDLRRRVLAEVRATPKAAAKASGAKASVRPARSWRPALAWGGAFAAVLIVAVVLVAALGSGGSGTTTIQASTGSAELQITSDRGDLIVHRLPQLPAGRIYEMWEQRGSAAPTPTGTLFAVTRSGSAAVGVPGSLSGVSAVLVTQEPAGGTLAPTSAPVIVARVT
ncbi:MAG TPA: anti-sigma factor [Solirubrobacteraceae bacterium]|nr:anti-sigma factor [Solirubrobacteraceae bacterium]